MFSETGKRRCQLTSEGRKRKPSPVALMELYAKIDCDIILRIVTQVQSSRSIKVGLASDSVHIPGRWELFGAKDHRLPP